MHRSQIMMIKMLAKEGDDRGGESRMKSRGFWSWFFGRSEASLLMFKTILQESLSYTYD
jgi:hypothetical protein